MNWLKTAAIVIWIRAHSDLLFRGLISLGIFFILNSIYRKYEAVLLVTNPEKLFKRAITTGISAPPIGITNKTPKMKASPISNSNVCSEDISP